MNKSIFFKKENLLAIILFFFSVFINQYYASKGVSPHDSFSHFDSGYRILQGEYPFNSYWIISGPLVDYIQSIFFYLFGTSWKSYVFHASFFNGIVTLATFFVLIKFEVKTIYSFLFSLLFGILAYPSSGTPFVDHHATFFFFAWHLLSDVSYKNRKELLLVSFASFLNFWFSIKTSTNCLCLHNISLDFNTIFLSQK